MNAKSDYAPIMLKTFPGLMQIFYKAVGKVYRYTIGPYTYIIIEQLHYYNTLNAKICILKNNNNFV